MKADLFGLFPVPVMRVSGALPPVLSSALAQHFVDQAVHGNTSSGNLSHTTILRPGDSPLFVEAAGKLTEPLGEFGRHLFGQHLGWSVKEMWVNVLETGGRQAMHNHANSFVSGVVYLTRSHASAQTVFMKSPGGHDFAFRNDHAGSLAGPYNSDKWVSPSPEPGDLLLFPSYLMHAVPPNEGERRITLSFNAIPTRLDSWGYAIGFTG